MPVVLMILKVLLALLAVLLLLLAAALLLPLGFAVEYRAGRIRLKAVYGPLRRTFWSFHLKRPAAPAPSNCSGWSACPTRKSASTPIRIRCRVVSASA